MSSPTGDRELLAAVVKQRRADLAMNQMEVWRAGGPSNTTLTEIENGRLEILTPATARKLDKGLQWQPGSAMNVWRTGGPPTALPGTVGGPTQDASETDYVEAPGAKVEAGITNEDLLREILRSRAEYDQIRAEVRELSGRVGRLEQQGS